MASIEQLFRAKIGKIIQMGHYNPPPSEKTDPTVSRIKELTENIAELVYQLNPSITYPVLYNKCTTSLGLINEYQIELLKPKTVDSDQSKKKKPVYNDIQVTNLSDSTTFTMRVYSYQADAISENTTQVSFLGKDNKPDPTADFMKQAQTAVCALTGCVYMADQKQLARTFLPEDQRILLSSLLTDSEELAQNTVLTISQQSCQQSIIESGLTDQAARILTECKKNNPHLFKCLIKQIADNLQREKTGQELEADFRFQTLKKALDIELVSYFNPRNLTKNTLWENRMIIKDRLKKLDRPNVFHINLTLGIPIALASLPFIVGGGYFLVTDYQQFFDYMRDLGLFGVAMAVLAAYNIRTGTIGIQEIKSKKRHMQNQLNSIGNLDAPDSPP